MSRRSYEEAAVAWRWLLVFELAALGACVDRGTFICDEDAQCGMGGRCEANGYCSATDGKCESGYRYSAYAPDGVADQCVASGCVLALGGAHGCARDDTGEV